MKKYTFTGNFSFMQPDANTLIVVDKLGAMDVAIDDGQGASRNAQFPDVTGLQDSYPTGEAATKAIRDAKPRNRVVIDGTQVWPEYGRGQEPTIRYGSDKDGGANVGLFWPPVNVATKQRASGYAAFVAEGIALSEGEDGSGNVPVPISGGTTGGSIGEQQTGGVVGNGSTEGQSEIAQMLLSHPVSLNWRYASRQALIDAAKADNWKHHRLELKRASGRTEVLIRGEVPADAKAVIYVEQQDGSVVYETYLSKVGTAGAVGGRRELLPAYVNSNALQADAKAIKYENLINVDNVRVWPPEGQAGFGPAAEFRTQKDGSVAQGAGAETGNVPIVDF